MRVHTSSTASRPAAAVAAFSVAVLLAACGGSSEDARAAVDAERSDGSGGSPTEGYPVTIENCGRTLTFDEAPSRVLTSYQPNLEVLIGLGQGDRVIGRAEYPGAEDVPLPPDQQEVLESIPVEQSEAPGGYWLPTKETAISLAPDFVLSGGFYEMEPAEGYATRDEWEEAGAQTYLSQCSLEQGAEITVEDTYQQILDMGRIFGVEEAAEARVEEIRTQIAEVEDRLVGVEPVNTLIVYTTDDPPYVQGASIEGQVLELAGGTNVLADQPQFFPANDEAIAALDVDAFLVFPAYEPDIDSLVERYPNLDASRDRHTVTTNYILTGGGVAGAWRIGDAVEGLARQLHPDAFEE